MQDSVERDKNRWVVSALTATGITVALVFLFRFPAPTVPLPTTVLTPPRPGPVVKMAKSDDSDALLKAETELRDLRPLFLPTARNAALPDPRLPGGTFLDSEQLMPAFREAEVRVGKDLPAVVQLNGEPLEKARPMDVFAPDATSLSLQGFGRRADLEVAPMPAGGGFIEVVALATGVRILAQPLPVSARTSNEKAWTPIEFLADVNAAGLASPLVVTESSRLEDVDVHYRNFLTRTFRIGDRLEPGFYRIIVGP